jgi:hypothetical protein
MNINNLNPANIALFKSRKFWLAVCELAFMVIIVLVPEFEGSRDVMILASMTVIGVAINGYAQEDKALAEKTGLRNQKYNKQP